jgi:hypothetical protein
MDANEVNYMAQIHGWCLINHSQPATISIFIFINFSILGNQLILISHSQQCFRDIVYFICYEKKEYALQCIVYYNRITDLKKSPFKLVEQNKRFKKCIQRGPKKFILQGEF